MSERPGGKRPGGRVIFNERQIERMRYLRQEADLPIAEIGKIMGCSMSTVRIYLGRPKMPFAMKQNIERPTNID